MQPPPWTLLAEPPSAKTPSMRCLPLGRRRSRLWRACRFSSSRMGDVGVDQQWSPNLHLPPEGKPRRAFCYHSPSDVSIKNKNMVSCRLLHGWLATQLRSCAAAWTSGETLGDQYRASVRPAVMSKTCQPLCALNVFGKKKIVCIFACCFISCYCFPWNAIFNFGPYVCTLSLPLMTGSLLSDRSDLSYDEVMNWKRNCWAWFSKLLFFPTPLFHCSIVIKYCLFKQRHKPLSIYLCICLITYFPFCLIKKFTNHCVKCGYFFPHTNFCHLSVQRHLKTRFREKPCNTLARPHGVNVTLSSAQRLHRSEFAVSTSGRKNKLLHRRSC